MLDWRLGDVVLGQYEVTGVVRSGGMGVVYRVWHRGWSTDLAMKVPRPELVATARGRAAFEGEAGSWVDLGAHPNVVSCAYVRRVDDVPCVFAEWVEGGSLAEAVRSRQLYAGGERAALRRILDLAVQVAWGVGHAHERGLVHQDVKPANVMIDRDGAAKVTDFGLAKARASAGEGRGDPAAGGGSGGPGGPGQPAGESLLVSYGGRTPAYCSPEQERAAVEGDAVGPATDVWSWAVTVLEAFAGGPPTNSGPQAGEALEELAASRTPLVGGAPALPAELVTVLRRCLHPDPAARPAGMAVVADEVAALHGHLLGEPYGRTTPPPVRLLADGLSNQALSLLDLGRPDEADTLWRRAIAADPHHPHATYNRGLWRWRTGRATDLELVDDLEEVRSSHEGDWVDEYLLGAAQLERGEVDAARALLDGAQARAPSAPDVALAARLARETQPPGPAVVFDGHRETVEALAVSPDARYVASVATDHAHPPRVDSDAGRALVHDIVTGRLVAALDGADRQVLGLAWRADGRVLAACGREGAVCWWDVEHGTLVGRFDGHGAAPIAVALSPDGALVVSADESGAVLVADAATGRLVRVLQDDQRLGTSQRHGAVAVTPDGRLVVRWEPATQRLRVWDLATGALHDSIQVGPRARAAVSSDGRAALVLMPGRSEVWDVVRGERVRALPSHLVVEPPVAVSGDGAWAVQGTGQGVRVWDLTTGRCLRTLTDHDTGVAAVAVDPGGRRVASSGWDGTVRVRGLAPPTPLAPWSHARPRCADELARDADVVDRALADAARHRDAGAVAEALAVLRAARDVTGYGRDRRLVDAWARLGRVAVRSGLRGAWPLGERDGGGLHQPFALAPSGRLLVLSGNGDDAQLVDVRTGGVLRGLGPHGDQVRCAAFGPREDVVVTGSMDRRVRVFDVATGRCRHVLEGHGDDVEAVATGPAPGLAVSGGRDGQVVLWDVGAGRRVRRLGYHDHVVHDVSFSADGSTAFSADADGLVLAWDVASGRRRCVLPGREGSRTDYASSADGRTVATVTDPVPGIPGAWVRVWDASTATPDGLGELRALLRGHEGRVHRLAVTADGATVVGACEDGTVRRWDVATQACTVTCTGHEGAVEALVVTDDGRFALSGGDDGTVRAWDLRTGACLRVVTTYGNGVVRLLAGEDACVLTTYAESRAETWELDWDYEAAEAPGAPDGGRTW